MQFGPQASLTGYLGMAMSVLVSCWQPNAALAQEQSDSVAKNNAAVVTLDHQAKSTREIADGMFGSAPAKGAPAAAASAVSSPAAPGQPPRIATPEMKAWLERMIRNNLPPEYEDDRKWGKQKEVWDGIRFRREGLKIETKRKKKMVNSGTWTRYKIRLVDPDKNLRIAFQRLEVMPDGRIAFEVVVDSSLDVFGRISQWARDVQIISLSANADAACRLTLAGHVKFHMNFLKLPPDIAIKPVVEQAHVDLTYYRVRRISQIGGDFAKVLGKGLRRVLDDKLEDMNGKLVGKINKQLDKHTDKLAFSTQDWLKAKLPMPSTPPQSAEAGM